jgi:NO-binding membrane sensor protein with MHYT domain
MTPVLLTYVSYAVALAVALIAVFWTTEILIARRLGFYLNSAAIAVVILGCAGVSYTELADCTFSKTPAFPRCEWSPLLLWILWSATLVVLPIFAISTVMLRRWSNNRIQSA